MAERAKQIAILGSTGSIGRNGLEVILASGGRLQAIALTANSRLEELVAQARRFHPRWVVAASTAVAKGFDFSGLPAGTELLVGPEGVEQVASSAEVDVVLAAIVGSAGLRGTWAALEAGKTVALANKETLVTAGPLVMELARRRGSCLLPVDSEHSAVFQALQAGRRSEVRRIVLTASGGPFRRHSREQLRQVTVEEALNHPNWDMGPKITVDSATMMNKALEIIEARWLFDLSPDQIDVVVHPQSVIHSMVEYVDGSVVAQLSPPDMKLPIQYALSWPHRTEGPAERIDWKQAMCLEFEPPDLERFPALGLGYEAARRGGTAGAVLNAANEAAVAAFLERRLPFHKIVPACRAVLACHNYDAHPSLSQLLELDGWARKEVAHWIQ
ncbi:MAG: 1-deoxy-D-xylulose-5-phosphate reductoisomerase [Planctomycetes bacterium]|nr:1-deoxy-D-xylulose-5-phosphate reductoisomerase [Planctomycetota bacterium]